MIEWIIFIIGSGFSLWYSIPSFRIIRSHGFYRFFAWEIIIGLVAINIRTWFVDAFAWYQIISWFFLILSVFPAITGFFYIKSDGRSVGNFEATTQLVTRGIYRYIRHPLYASLLYLNWGLFFKSPSILEACLSIVASAFLFATARADETECLIKFGQQYIRYMKETRMFIPYVF
jgi:protein-S-isoprenylcysteine O-methyltransferase Ste14